jgi:hypothetical protein
MTLCLKKPIEFVLVFDHFLNVSALDAGKHSRNPFKNLFTQQRISGLKYALDQ